MTINLSNSVAWDAVVGADSYDVELLNGALGLIKSLNVAVAVVTALALLGDQSQGNFYVRVRARKESPAFTGAFTEPLALEFLPLTIPQNLRVE